MAYYSLQFQINVIYKNTIYISKWTKVIHVNFEKLKNSSNKKLAMAPREHSQETDKVDLFEKGCMYFCDSPSFQMSAALVSQHHRQEFRKYSFHLRSMNTMLLRKSKNISWLPLGSFHKLRLHLGVGRWSEKRVQGL